MFIGHEFGRKNEQAVVFSGLDQCLLNDAEWDDYKVKRKDEESLRLSFVNAFPVKMLTY